MINWLRYFLTHKFAPLFAIGALLLLLWTLAEALRAVLPLPFTHVAFLDVGQGDAMFIETPQHQRLLIDGGPDSRVVRKLTARLPLFDQSLSVVILTHPDADHLNGILAVVERLPVRAVFMAGVFKPTSTYHTFLKVIESKHIPAFQLVKDQQIELDNNIKLEALWPSESVVGFDLNKTNDTGIVTRLTVGERSFLLTADIESPIEAKLVEDNLPATDILKVAHHGSNTSSSPEFLMAASPGLAVIEAGAGNKYGHPRPETLQNLAPSAIYRTDQNGDIDIWTDGVKLWVSTQK